VKAENIIVYLWMCGFIGSACIQLIFPEPFASYSTWDYNSGWQSELAIWNIGIISVLVALIRVGVTLSPVLPGLAFMSFLFGMNHLVALVGNPGACSHWAGVIANFAITGIYLIWRMSSYVPQRK